MTGNCSKRNTKNRITKGRRQNTLKTKTALNVGRPVQLTITPWLTLTFGKKRIVNHSWPCSKVRRGVALIAQLIEWLDHVLEAGPSAAARIQMGPHGCLLHVFPHSLPCFLSLSLLSCQMRLKKAKNNLVVALHEVRESPGIQMTESKRKGNHC